MEVPAGMAVDRVRNLARPSSSVSPPTNEHVYETDMQPNLLYQSDRNDMQPNSMYQSDKKDDMQPNALYHGEEKKKSNSKKLTAENPLYDAQPTTASGDHMKTRPHPKQTAKRTSENPLYDGNFRRSAAPSLEKDSAQVDQQKLHDHQREILNRRNVKEPSKPETRTGHDASSGGDSYMYVQT